MKSRAVLEINLERIKQNAQILKNIKPQSFFCPILKADAYGHGVIPIAKTLWDIGVNQVGVLNAEEAYPILKAIPKINILIFDPLIPKEELNWIVKNNLTIVCSNWKDLENLSNLNKKTQIHLKFETGFSRLGFQLNSAKKFYEFFKKNPLLKLKGIGTHLVSGEDLGDKDSFSFLQLKKFLKLIKLFPKAKNHILNSPALVSQFAHCDSSNLGSRPGISLYGIKPKIFFQTKKAQKKWSQLNLQPVSCLKSHIVALQEIPKKTPVSYGARWKASKKSKIATVSLGYAEGFFRAQDHSKREVLFRGQRVPIVGTVCMNFFMIDLTNIKQKKPIRLGEEVIIFGSNKKSLSVEEQATAINTIPYELFTSIGSKVKRVYI